MKRRISAAVMALVMLLPAGSCSFRDHTQPIFPEHSDTEDNNSPADDKHGSLGYTKADIDTVNEQVEKLLDDIKLPDNEDAVKEDIDVLFDSVALAYEAYSASHIDYCLDWNSSKAEREYDDCALTYSLVYEAVSYALHHGYNSKDYSDLFADYIDEDYLEFYTTPSMSLKRLEGYTKVDYELIDERSDEYYDIYYDDSLSDDEKSRRCAEIYLDILSEYSTDTFYDYYSRDYTPEEIIAAGKSIRKNLMPIYDDVIKACYDAPQSTRIYNSNTKPDELFEIIKKYADRISPEVAESAQRIIDTGHYRIAKGDNCYTGSLTAELPYSDDAIVYIYCEGDYDDLRTAIHEFGHYHASRFDDTPIYSVVANDDIAEIQSQAMELLFMQFYDEIYGKKAEAMRLFNIAGMLLNIEVSFRIGEFEYTVLQNRDTYTADDVLDCYNRIMGAYAKDYPFYYIDHMFIYPGYYISYGVSALGALEILDDVFNAPQSAAEKYSRFAHISSTDPDVKLREALAENGFSDILTDEYIDRIYDDIRRYLNSLK